MTGKGIKRVTGRGGQKRREETLIAYVRGFAERE